MKSKGSGHWQNTVKRLSKFSHNLQKRQMAVSLEMI
ncbi:hypothetical protein MUY_002527 [Bacillus licheniformis WX-02]|nr:hypothetical protein MUY_002527 [Bacillus licheniformis WX-02]